ncbi:hypothetical protein DPMN_188421 [Dreissena polymorpha]|uniref:Uncharacterized protein n=1 Tax=Dreissena polymorpha TaxID=45954 RepID=A0A9D4DQU9_DREPO|nr:hypothetical protein DPMN_188421 [Dreissena polymorpha]
MSRLKRTVGKSGDGTETVEDMSATDKWVWKGFSFLKDHIESVSIRGRGREPTEVIIQSDSGSESQPTEPPSHRLSTESWAPKTIIALAASTLPCTHNHHHKLQIAIPTSWT